MGCPRVWGGRRVAGGDAAAGYRLAYRDEGAGVPATVVGALPSESTYVRRALTHLGRRVMRRHGNRGHGRVF